MFVRYRNIFLGLLRSILSMCRFFFSSKKKKKIDIIFYYPQHFNRTLPNDQFLLDSFLKLCSHNNLNYLLLEEPDWKTDAPRNDNALAFDFYFILILLLRKVIPITWYKHFELRDQKIGYYLRKLTFGRFHSNTYITLSNSLGGVLRGYSPKSNIFDYQHGIISSSQPGFFNKKNPTELIELNDKKVLVWGKGFKEIFLKGNKRHYYQDRVFVLGYPTNIEVKEERKIVPRDILFSLQFMKDFTMDENLLMLEKIEESIEGVKMIIERLDIKFLLKHHPRFNDAIDLDYLIRKYPFLEFTSKPLEELYKETLLHITFFSTTTFEYAQYGIPTYFLESEQLTWARDFFYNDFNYPIVLQKTLKAQIEYYLNKPQSYSVDSDEVKKWFGYFYQPINEKIFLSLIK